MSTNMEPPARHPAPRSATPSRSPDGLRAVKGQRPGSSDSETSQASSSATSHSLAKKSPYNSQLPSFTRVDRGRTASPLGFGRPSAQYLAGAQEPGTNNKGTSPLAPPVEFQRGHRARQHSQGYFEPSLPSSSLSDHANSMAGHGPLTASQIAAQTAFQHRSAEHTRKRSQTVPSPQDEANQVRRSSKGSIPPISTVNEDAAHQAALAEHQYRNGLIGANPAATAAASAFPRNLIPQAISPVEGPEEAKKKKGLKRFRPAHIGISRDKDKEAKDKPLPSPNKIVSNPSGLSQVINASQTSLVDSLSSTNSSMYNLTNASTSTMISAPALDRNQSYETKEKTHKHHGLRQKLKLKDKDDHHSLPLSSASSNSRPVDANNQISLYSFQPSSPGPTSGFSKSVSGLDLRHAGRALRERKKEEKAEKANMLEPINSRGESVEGEAVGLGLSTSLSGFSAGTSYMSSTPYANDAQLQHMLAGFGLNNMAADDAWDFLKAKILVIFEGEDIKIAIEELNKLVVIHVQRCVQKHMPSVIIEDLEDLFQTGFMSLNHTLRAIPDERLVPSLVSMWLFVFGKVLPFMQMVFLPLDHEFKGKGSVLTTPQAAAGFWGVLPNSGHGGGLSSSPPTDGSDGMTAAGEELEVRRILLISFRDHVILPRYNALKATFSRLSLESIDASLAALSTTAGNTATGDRPGTAQSLDPNYASYNSQSSTLLGTVSSGGRSRAISNVSNPAQDVAFESFSSPPTARPTDTSSSVVTETVGRMLQCVSVLGSVQSGDAKQEKIEDLAKELKLNWLGRGRTGRNRRGFVGTRVARPVTLRSVDTVHEREGSPTPTPTRTGTVNKDGREKESEAKRRSLL